MKKSQANAQNEAETDRLYLTAQQAAAELNVALSTIYAYVSRGFIQSVPDDDGRRHLYLAEDVRQLRSRRQRLGKDARKPGDKTATISWGAPILDTEISLIADERLYYRGIDACKMADTATLEDVATLLWGCDDEDPFAVNEDTPLPPLAQMLLEAKGVDPITRTLSALPHIAADDLSKFNMTPQGRSQLGARLLRAVTSLIVGKPYGGKNRDLAIHAFAAQAWAPDDPRADLLLRQALVLSAEHELNVSSFTVRCAVSSGSTLYHSIIAGLSALTGPKHGGATLGMNVLLEELDQAPSPQDLVRRRLESGQAFRGFDHPLYPHGDPRATYLIAAVAEQFPDDPFVAKVIDLLNVLESAAGAHPTVDFALSLIGRTLNLSEHAGISIFALGRTVGWVAHAMEQERDASIIRPRARYVGLAPKEKL